MCLTSLLSRISEMLTQDWLDRACQKFGQQTPKLAFPATKRHMSGDDVAEMVIEVLAYPMVDIADAPLSRNSKV